MGLVVTVVPPFGHFANMSSLVYIRGRLALVVRAPRTCRVAAATARPGIWPGGNLGFGAPLGARCMNPGDPLMARYRNQ